MKSHRSPADGTICASELEHRGAPIPQCIAAHPPKKDRTNRKGDISFETSPSLSDFSKFWFGPDHNVCIPGITRAPRACARTSLIRPLAQPLQELPHFHLSGCPEPRIVAESRRWWLVCPLLLEDRSSVETNATPKPHEY